MADDLYAAPHATVEDPCACGHARNAHANREGQCCVGECPCPFWVQHKISEADAPETIADRLDAIGRDLESIVRRYNADGQPIVALRAQQIVVAIHDFVNADGGSMPFEETPWTWEPDA